MSVPTAPSASPEPNHTAAWTRRFAALEIPVLAETAAELEDLRPVEDDVDARMLAEVLARDPLMTLKLLGSVATQGSGRRLHDAETVTEALVLMGITPFFRAFGPQPTIEQHLAGSPEALAGLREVLRRADRAARFAAAFAIRRGDHDAAVLQEAALLHDFAEMLLWLHAPEIALEIQRRQAADPGLRSTIVQRELLHAELTDVQHALMRLWRLPEVLVRITDDRHDVDSQVRTVLLAIRVARHSMQGWDNAAIPDDLRDIGALLMLTPDAVRQLLQDIDA
jgi:HD-like signal output (HDOD) protein